MQRFLLSSALTYCKQRDDLTLSDYSQLVSNQFHPRPFVHCSTDQSCEPGNQVPFIEASPVLPTTGEGVKYEVLGMIVLLWSEEFDDCFLRTMIAKVEEDDVGIGIRCSVEDKDIFDIETEVD